MPINKNVNFNQHLDDSAALVEVWADAVTWREVVIWQDLYILYI